MRQALDARCRQPSARNRDASPCRPACAAAFAPYQLRHARAVAMARGGVPLNVIQRQLGHTDLGVTSVYLCGIDNAENIDTIHARKPPMMPASAGQRLSPSRFRAVAQSDQENREAAHTQAYI
jgi:hypothetical protein